MRHSHGFQQMYLSYKYSVPSIWSKEKTLSFAIFIHFGNIDHVCLQGEGDKGAAQEAEQLNVSGICLFYFYFPAPMEGTAEEENPLKTFVLEWRPSN